jgi:hypothetical protein
MLFARAEDGEVRSLTAVGADTIVRADKRRPADQAEKGPDLLLDAKDAGYMAKCLRPRWKSEVVLYHHNSPCKKMFNKGPPPLPGLAY